MAGGQNLASMFSTRVDERFTRESQATLVLNNDYKFTGVKTVNVYSIPTVAMGNYTREGTDRYGTPQDLTRNVQALTVDQDRAWTFIIDKGDKIQSQMVMEAGKAISRQMSEVVIPEYDKYVFHKLAKAACDNGATDATAATKEAQNAYELLLAAQEKLGNDNVPDKGRVCLCSYGFANQLKLDQNFMRYGDASQHMLDRGVMGEVDGTKIVKVPAGHLPTGCQFILTHPVAATAPKILSEYRIHDNPPGISGWLCEGRFIYDAFILNEKKNAIWYQGTVVTTDVPSGMNYPQEQHIMQAKAAAAPTTKKA